MNSFYPRPLAILFVIFLILLSCNPEKQDKRSEYEKFLAEHEYLNRDYGQVKEAKKVDRPDLAWEQDFINTMDPKTKKPEQQRLIKARKLAKKQLSGKRASVPWEERGPSNVGGRTRALAYDPAVTNKVWAGGVTGGLWYNNDITSVSSTWQSVDDFWETIAITCMAFDPNNSDVIYVGTGEGWLNASSRGAGIWKSEDGGDTWEQLESSTDLFFINDLVVRDESNGASAGVLYVGSSRTFYRGTNHGQNGLYRSADGGATLTQVATTSVTDLSVSADNSRVWAGTYEGDIAYSENGTSWIISQETTGSRVNIACAPSNANYVYALVESGLALDAVLYTDDNGATWQSVNEPDDVDLGISATDFTRGQAWYDLVIAVDPNDENTIVAGGINLFRSTDNGTNWTQISKWSNNANMNQLSASFVHADQHAIIFKEGSSSEVIFGTDGGVFYTEDLTNAGDQDVISSRNGGYNVTQFYTCALHPDEGVNFFLGGTQDNGTQRFESAGVNATVDVFGGDGAYCAIDQDDPDFQIVSYVFNNYGLSTNGGQSFNISLQNEDDFGAFINPADYDDNLNILYSAWNSDNINRISGVTTSPSDERISLTLGAQASHFRVSPYTTSSTTLFVGTQGGRLFKITNADGSSPSADDISGSAFPTGSVSCVEIGASEDELLVTFSNYGVTSIWYTDDGGQTWQAKEGNLPDLPVRWALFNPNNRNEVILATELGIWETQDLSSTSPSWSAANDGLANVRVDMLQIRSSDNLVIAATHGRGMFSFIGFGEGPPNANFTADNTISCAGDLNVNFTNTTSSFPEATGYEWTFPGGTPGTSDQETPPTVTYSTPGVYDVTLTVTNSLGTNTETKSNYINVATSILPPFSEGFEGETFPPDCWLFSRGDNGLGTTNDWIKSDDGNSGSGAAYVEFENVTGGDAEDWLITPNLDLSKGLKSRLTFFAKQTYGGEFGTTYQVRASTTSQSDLSTFVVVQEYTESDLPTGSYSSFNVSLEDYDGNDEVYLAFVMVQDDGDDWFLDDISITTSEIAIEVTGEVEFCSDALNTNLSVEDDNDFTYQWKRDGTAISGQTSASISPDESGDYSVDVTYSGETITSDTVTITVNQVPIINDQSDNLVVCTGVEATLSIDASGSDLTYQWSLDGETLTDDEERIGTDSSTLVFGSVTSAAAGTYSCVITGNSCSVTSTDILVTVNITPSIVSQPDTIVSCDDDPVVFSVDVEGEDISYQWYYNNEALVDATQVFGSTTAELSIFGPTEENNGEYYCEILTDCPTLRTDTVTLTYGVCTSVDKQLSQQVSLFPNPSDGRITIDLQEIQGARNVSYTIFSMNGQVLQSDKIVGVQNQLNLELTDLPRGMYFINLEVGEVEIVKTFVIEN